MLDGREPELEALRSRLDTARAGGSFAVVLHGEAGIGKTALLRELTAMAADVTLLAAEGHEAEARLPFAGLRALVAPVLALRDALPAGQAASLAAALELEEPTPFDRFAVPMALLGLLARAAAERPVLVVVDDLHWLDVASRDALLFAARRLAAPGVGIVMATRDDDVVAAAARGVDALPIGPVDDATARRIVRAADPTLPAAVVEQVVAAAQGNPLALVELPANADRDAALLALPPATGPLLEAAFARHLQALTVDERRAVTAAAAMEGGTVSWLLAALRALRIDAAALDAPEREQLLGVSADRVTFRHPLLRAVAYHSAPEADRRAAHVALATTAPDAARRAWQLAAAARGEDAEAAAAMEDAAWQARRVGAHVEAAAAYASAAGLSAAGPDRARRTVEAATELTLVGRLDEALERLDAIADEVPAELRPRVDRLRAHVAMRQGDPAQAVRRLVAEADRLLDEDDADAAVELLLEASFAPMVSGDLALLDLLLERAVPAAARAGAQARTLVELLAGSHLVGRGRNAEAEAALARVEPQLGDVEVLAHPEVVGMAAQCSMWIGADARSERIVERMLDRYEKAGAAGRLPYPLNLRAQLALRRAAWADARRDAGEAARLAGDTGQPLMVALAGALLARAETWAGRHDDALAHVATAREALTGEGVGALAAHVDAAHGFALLAAGRAGEAVGPLRRAREFERRNGFHQPAFSGAAPDLVEALALSGDLAAARAEQDQLRAEAELTGAAWARAVALRGDVLLAEDDVAAVEAAAAAALANQEAGMPHERARTELAAGERLLALRAAAAAREHFERAVAAFDELGAPRFAQRARERLATAGALPEGLAGTPLNEEERAIAALVADGRTNRQIAAELLLSEKTLERRLTALFRKVGVRSRIELAAHVARDPSAAA